MKLLSTSEVKTKKAGCIYQWRPLLISHNEIIVRTRPGLAVVAGQGTAVIIELFVLSDGTGAGDDATDLDK